jgi:hypothetical protein
MLDDVATVRLIARYRKEVTGAVDDAQLHALGDACGTDAASALNGTCSILVERKSYANYWITSL